MHAFAVLAITVVSYAVAQQTFQSTLFDLPAELPPDDYALLSQLEDASKKEVKDAEKSKKINKAALHQPQVEPPPQQFAFVEPRALPQPSPVVTPAPFSFSTLPTHAQPALHSHLTMTPLSLPLNLTPPQPPQPFMLPTHSSLGAFIFPTHPTLPPFTFPAHHTISPFTVTPPSQLSLTGTSQFPHLQHFGSQPQVMQPLQQHFEGSTLLIQPPGIHQPQNNVQITPFQNTAENALHYKRAQSQKQMQPSILQPHQQSQQSGHVAQQQLPYRELPQQLTPVQSQFPYMQHLVSPNSPQQQQLHPFQQHNGEQYYGYPSYPNQHPQSAGVTQPQNQQFLQPGAQSQNQQFLQPGAQSHQIVGFQPNQQQRVSQQPYEQVVAAGQTLASVPQLGSPPLQAISNTQNTEKRSGQVERVSNSTPNRVSIWFKEEFNTTECERNLSTIAEKFRAKFPVYLRKGGKDGALADLVEQRLTECDRKSSASHWDKVDRLLNKISLSKSEESECRSGLVQERISCMNLLHYACQLIDPSFTFRLVPARITIQEARQAENGAEKCRKVVRLVKKRLEG